MFSPGGMCLYFYVALTTVLSLGLASESSTTPLDICQDPSFDAAVSISESHVLLFKGDSLWVLDLREYQVSIAYPSKAILDACWSNTNDFYSDPYYLWTRHSEDKYSKNQICMERAGQVCQLAVDVVASPNDIFYSNSTSSEIEVVPGIFHHSQMMCQKDVYKNVIEFMISSRSYNLPAKSVKQVWLSGLHFNAYVSYTPTTYDPHKVIFKTELQKLYREMSSSNDSQVSFSDNRIENVRTFVTLPYGEMMLFFDEEFCYISYYSLECNRRSTISLIGCTMPTTQDVLPSQLHIVRQVPGKEPIPPRQSALGFEANITATTTTGSTISQSVSMAGTSSSSSTQVSANWSDLGSVSTLIDIKSTTRPNVPASTSTAKSVTSEPARSTAATTTSSSVLLSTLSSPTSWANVATTPVTTWTTAQGPVSTDNTNWTSAPSVAATISTEDTFARTHLNQYGTDFLYERRTLYLHGHEQSGPRYDFGTWSHHFRFLRIGFYTFALLSARALFVSLLFLATSHLAAFVIILTLKKILHCRFDTEVLFLIYRSMFMRAFAFY